jgi:ABC-2 type transport system ATP-binding protein
MTTQTQKAALQLDKLRKVYGNKTAVDSIDLTVPAGSFFGLVGPNGAGKTTSISMATGLLRPDDGTAYIFGIDIWEQPEEAKEFIGLLPDGLAMPERLTGREALTYLGLLRGINANELAKRVSELLHVLGFDDDEGKLIMDYSTGMRKKIGLATALLHGPKLLILDEPFEAVDPVSASTIKKILQKFVSSGGTVIFSSHVMALVEQLCDSVAIINKGTVMATGLLDDVRAGKTLEARFVELVGGEDDGKGGLAWLAS